tara:strand:+ start:1853 stop:3709 length:1857 start_codon:yes stop_codon:yes gene_type:complete
MSGTVVFEDAKLQAVELIAETVTLNNFSVSTATTFQQTTNASNVTTNTLRFTNPTTAFVTTGNVEVGTANLFVDTATGGVGIGTGSPSHALNVRATSGDAAVHIQAQGNAGDSILYFNGAATNQRKCAIISSNVAPASYCKQDLHFCMETTNDLSDVDITDSKMVLTNAGNVGIGTTSPQDLFHMYGASDSALRVETDTGQAQILLRAGATTRRACRIDFSRADTGAQYAWIIGDYNQNATDDLTLGTSGGGRIMTLTQGGNVGIGTASPRSGHILHVSKNVSTSGMINIARIGGDTSSYNTLVFGSKEGRPHIGGHRGDYGLWADLSLQNDLMVLKQSNMTVGIGTVSPTAKLTVIGATGSMSSAARVYFRWNDYISGSAGAAYPIRGTGNWVNMSIYANGAIVSSSYFVSHAGTASASDERIKKNIVDADDVECLETLRLLKPKKYEYKNAVERGEEPVWGFIAQEVANVLPHATQLRQDVIPNIYELSNVSSSNVITFTNFNTSNLESNATTLIRTIGADGEQHDIHLEEVIDEHAIRVKEDLTDWIGSVDETGNVVAGNQLFVYGQEVDDFVFLKKESIFTVTTAALQEVDRQLQAEKAKVADLLARVEALENA